MANIAVIGAGIGGLSATAHLLSQGHEVTVFERDSHPGGRSAKRVFNTAHGEYLLECGPAVFTMLETGKMPFVELGQKLEDHVEMIKVDPAYQGRFGDGSVLDWPGNRQDIHQAISQFVSPREAAGFGKYTKWLEKLVEIEYDKFIAANFHKPTDIIKNPISLMRLLQMGAFKKMDKKVRDFLVDERLIAMSTFQALYAGVSPEEALAVYCIISYMDLVEGVYYPKGGMHKYPQALADACSDAGAKFNYDMKVERVSKTSNGIEVKANSMSDNYDSVICNADLAYAYPQIFGMDMPKKVEKGKYSPSCMLYVVGGKATSKKEAHHTIHFARNSKYGFNDLVKRRQIMKDPSFLISNPTLTDPTISPEGTDVFYVLEPSPHLDSQVDFAYNREAHQERLKGLLTKGGVTFDRIDCEVFIDPVDWEAQGMYQGTPFSMAHTFFQSGPFRPTNAVKQIPGLFLCGTGTTPGVGIPMVIESGKLAAEKASMFLKKSNK